MTGTQGAIQQLEPIISLRGLCSDGAVLNVRSAALLAPAAAGALHDLRMGWIHRALATLASLARNPPTAAAPAEHGSALDALA